MKDILALASCLADYLETNGVGTQGVDLFVMQLPEVPQVGTALVMTGGPILTGNPTRNITFQIHHRNPSAEEGLRKATEINNLLNNKWNIVPGFPGRVESASEAGAAFKDESGNLIYPLSYAVVSTTQR